MTSNSPRETQQIAKEFGKKLKPGHWIGLFGQLGAGKTTFIQGLARGMGVVFPYVNSPSFTLIHEYGPLIHVDLYRLTDSQEVEALGLEDYADKVVVIEWAEKFEKKLDFRVRIENISANRRSIEII